MKTIPLIKTTFALIKKIKRKTPVKNGSFLLRCLFNYFKRAQDGYDDATDNVDFRKNGKDTKRPTDDFTCNGNPTGDIACQTDNRAHDNTDYYVNDNAYQKGLLIGKGKKVSSSPYSQLL